MKMVVACIAACVVAGGARAEEPLSVMSYGVDLKPRLEAGDPEAIAFVTGAIAALQLRSSQGDPLLFWLRPCVATTFMPVDDVLPHILQAIDAGADARGLGQLAGHAILTGAAAYCGQTLDLPDGG